jgi:hypothetical protein
MPVRDVGRIALEQDDQDDAQTHRDGEERQQAPHADEHLDIRRKPVPAAGSQPPDLLRPARHLVFHAAPSRSFPKANRPDDRPSSA